MLIFSYFHKSRLLYGLPVFIVQKSWIYRIDKVMITNIKQLLKLPIRTNYNILKILLGLPDLNTYLICRLLKLKDKYEYIFNEKLTMYDKVIKEVININDIHSKIKIFMRKKYIINDQFNNRLKNRIHSWYVDSDFLLIKFMCHRGCFREDIFQKYILCKKENNAIKHVINECIELIELRYKLI